MSTPTVPLTALHTAQAFALLAEVWFDLVSVRSAPELALEVFVRVPTGDDVQSIANKWLGGDGQPCVTMRTHSDGIHTRADLPFGEGSDLDSPNVMYRAAIVVRVYAVDPIGRAS